MKLEKEKNCKTSPIYGILKEILQTHLWNRNRLTDLEKEFMVARGNDGRRDSSGIWVDMNTLLFLKWMTNKDLLYSTGNSVECNVADMTGREFE